MSQTVILTSPALPPTPAPPTTARVAWVDYLKGITIFLVVAGHGIGGLHTAGIVPDAAFNYPYRWIYAFHMPGFFLAAGLFASRSLRHGFAEFLDGKLRGIAYPYLLWSVIQWASHMVMASHTNTPPDRFQLLKLFYVAPMNFWFLYTLFAILMVYALFTHLRIGPPVFLLIAVALHLGSSTPPDWFWGLGLAVASNLLYFAIGVVLSDKLNSLAATASVSLLLALATACFTLMSVAVYCDVSHRFPFARAVPALLGITALFSISAVLAVRRKLIGISSLGVLSMEIYVAHGLALVFTRVALSRILGIRSWPVYVIAGISMGVLAPVALAWVCNKTGFPYLYRLPRKLKPTAPFALP
ncbi:MAG: acyltransferase [Planctomycetota bacterium]|nr:acyltransferase [Planctomycetota bacterium]